PERRAIEKGARVGPCVGAHLLVVADDAVDLGHAGEGRGLGLRRAAGHHDARIRALALGAADRLARLAHRFRRHRAGVHHHGAVEARALRIAADHLGLVGIEAAAESEDVDAHAAPIANSAGSNRPSNSYCTGPVISTWLSLSRQSI